MDASEAERILSERVKEARIRHERASAAVRDLTSEIPSGFAHPDGAFRIKRAFEEQRAARTYLAKALEGLNDFLLYGIVPQESKPTADSSRERALEGALFGLYQAWSKLPTPSDRLRPYFAEKFRQMIVPGCKLYKGGVEAVRHMLFKSKTGLLDYLAANNRIDLSVESLVLSGEWDDLFDPQDRKRAAEKLEGTDISAPRSVGRAASGS